jgi:hypothetical protein
MTINKKDIRIGILDPMGYNNNPLILRGVSMVLRYNLSNLSLFITINIYIYINNEYSLWENLKVGYKI